MKTHDQGAFPQLSVVLYLAFFLHKATASHVSIYMFLTIQYMTVSSLCNNLIHKNATVIPSSSETYADALKGNMVMGGI